MYSYVSPPMKIVLVVVQVDPGVVQVDPGVVVEDSYLYSPILVLKRVGSLGFDLRFLDVFPCSRFENAYLLRLLDEYSLMYCVKNQYRPDFNSDMIILFADNVSKCITRRDSFTATETPLDTVSFMTSSM